MKLIDLLKIELPDWGGWPKGAEKVWQSGIDGELYFYDITETRMKPRGIRLSVCSETGNGNWVSRKQYESALMGDEVATSKHSAHSFLEKGVQHMKDRATQRDSEDGERSMKACVDAFNAMFGHSLTETQGWQFMVLLKMARSRNKFNPDDYEDGAAYTGLAGEAHSNEKK